MVNRGLVPLDYRLRDGDLVEILIDGTRPSATDWAMGKTHFTATAAQALANLKNDII
jgi:(p)ppGpp synthase/HD superfamily hydrolase